MTDAELDRYHLIDVERTIRDALRCAGKPVTTQNIIHCMFDMPDGGCYADWIGNPSNTGEPACDYETRWQAVCRILKRWLPQLL